MMSDSNKPLSVLFLTLVPFPNGLAQTNRLISMARGLISAGCKVKVLCLKPTETAESYRNMSNSGIFAGIEYRYPAGTTLRSKNPLIRLYQYVNGCINTTALILREKRKVKPDFVFIGIVPFSVYTWFYIWCRLLHIRFIQERSEYPFIKAGKSFLDPLILSLYLKVVCKYFDGFIVITKALSSYFTPYLRKNCPVYKLPILVEPERFAHSFPDADIKYIAYCGSMQGSKDGVPDLINAFSQIRKYFPEVYLYLIGSTEFTGFNELRDLIERLSVENRVKFTGIIGRDELPEMIAKSLLLVLARPESRQAEGGFPTKVGEYLATGKPVLVTDVGEITEYLQDGVNAFIARPGDTQHFAEKMKYILDHYDEAVVVGARGQNLARSTFNYTYQGKLLAGWLDNLRK